MTDEDSLEAQLQVVTGSACLTISNLDNRRPDGEDKAREMGELEWDEGRG